MFLIVVLQRTERGGSRRTCEMPWAKASDRDVSLNFACLISSGARSGQDRRGWWHHGGLYGMVWQRTVKVYQWHMGGWVLTTELNEVEL